MLKTFGLLFIFAISILAFPLEKILARNNDDIVSKLIITEIKIGGPGTIIDETEYKEFITIFNPTTDVVSFNGSEWILEYAKSSYNSACDALSWDDQEPSNVNKLDLSDRGPLAPNAVISIPDLSITDTIGGSIRILEKRDDMVIVHDLVGWDKDSVSRAPCLDEQKDASDQIIRTPANFPTVGKTVGKSIQRYLDCDLMLPIDTDNNFDDFAPPGDPSPGVLAGPLKKCNEEPETVPNNTCEGIIISEVLPNPAGTDSGKEFIELHNPTNKAISLEDCQLETTASSKNNLKFEEENIVPGQYRAFYELSLVNSGGGTVYLLDTDNDEISAFEYPGDLDDDVAWARFSGSFAATFAPTPDAANELLENKPCPEGQFRNEETNRCNNIVLEAGGLNTCSPGKKRNPSTNRCRSIASLASALKPCAADQARNPETNRCKKSVSGSVLKPCSAGQIRNPKTNRCKKSSSGSELKPCAKGKERNPETNRCRNVVGILGTNGQNPVQDIPAATAGKQGFFLAAASVIGALCYGLWEWRNEAILAFLNLKKKLLGTA